MNHEEVLNDILSHCCNNPVSEGSDLKTFRLDLHCDVAIVTARLIEHNIDENGKHSYKYEIHDVKF